MNNLPLKLDQYNDKLEKETMEIILDEIFGEIEIFLFVVLLYFLYLSFSILFIRKLKYI